MTATAQKLETSTKVRMTADEFLASVLSFGPGKHELIHGVVRAMAPASPTHGTIQMRLGQLIGNHLAQHRNDCRVISEAGVQPRVRGKTNVRVPELLVTCGPPPAASDRIVAAPLIIIEVLSPGNDNETDASIIACASIPSVQEMLSVDSTRRLVEIWRRDSKGDWPVDPETLTGAGVVRLDTLNFAMSLDDIYAGTHLAVSSAVS